MDRFTVTANTRLPRRPILDGNQPPLSYSAFPLKPQNRDPSFSTYLSSEDPKPTLIPQNPLPKHLSEENEISIFDAQKYFNEGQDQKHQKQSNTTCVSVNANVNPTETPNLDRVAESYDAVRYSSSSSYGRNYRARSFHATPTASSEASWNSQSGLLSNPPGSMAVSMRNIQLEEKKKGSWFFRRKCPCSGKKSVQVEDKFSVSEPKKQRPKTGEACPCPCPDQSLEKKLGVRLGEIDHTKVKSKSESFSHDSRFAVAAAAAAAAAAEIGVGRRVVSSSSSTRSFNDSGGFSFPILNPPNNNNRKLGLHLLEVPPRESLEVFRPSDEDPLGVVTENSHFNYSPRTRPPIEDDLVSDASSDLFEIESFSTQSTTYPMYKTRDSLDETLSFDSRTTRYGANGLLNFRHSLDETTAATTTTTTTTATPSRAPTEYCYEPSEASIEWSVTTAEGFDRASVTNMSVSASEFEEVRFGNGGGGGGGEERNYKGSQGNGRRKSVNGLLMSCRCEKAVNVGPHPHPMRGPSSDHQQQRHGFGSGFPVEASGRIQAASVPSAAYI